MGVTHKLKLFNLGKRDRYTFRKLNLVPESSGQDAEDPSRVSRSMLMAEIFQAFYTVIQKYKISMGDKSIYWIIILETAVDRHLDRWENVDEWQACIFRL
jgi:hypothetical protein